MTDHSMNGSDLKKSRRRKPADDVLKTDRLPPHSVEAEQGVLGCILLSPMTVIPQCQLVLRGGPEEFYDLRHQTIYRNIIAMQEKQQAVDVITLMQRLKDCELLEQVGGITYLNTIQDSVPSAANASYYLDIVSEKHTLRRMIHVCTDAVARVYEHEGMVHELLDEIERDVLQIRPADHVGGSHIRTLVQEAQGRIENLFQSRGAISGLSTGIPDLDHNTDGLHPGEMVVIAAFPSTGKTAMALNIAMHNALNGIPVAVLSLEMQPVALTVRAICACSRVNLFDVRDQRCSDDDFQRMSETALKISNAPVYLENANGYTIGQIKAALRRMKQQHGIRLAIIDYLQLISNPSESREQEVSGISKGIKSAAMELGIPIITLSQLNDDGKLRESRAIGQDADSIWKLANDGDKVPHDQPIKLSVEKNREGPPATINLIFQKQFTRFESAAKVSDEDIPNDAQGELV